MCGQRPGQRAALPLGPQPQVDAVRLPAVGDRRQQPDDLADHAIAILLDAQDRADANEGELHLDAEVLQRIGGQEIGMRIIHPREAGQIHLLDVTGLDITEVFQHALVALAQGGLGFLLGFLAEQVV